jgi:hypothetical protein
MYYFARDKFYFWGIKILGRGLQGYIGTQAKVQRCTSTNILPCIQHKQEMAPANNLAQRADKKKKKNLKK